VVNWVAGVHAVLLRFSTQRWFRRNATVARCARAENVVTRAIGALGRVGSCSLSLTSELRFSDAYTTARVLKEPALVLLRSSGIGKGAGIWRGLAGSRVAWIGLLD